MYVNLKCPDLLEPLKLYGEGDYNLNVVKEVKVTESFLGLDSGVMGCNMEKTYENCTTTTYIESVIQQCGCLPFSIYLSDKVKICYDRHDKAVYV